MDDSVYMKLTVLAGKQFLCKVTAGTAHSLEECDKCGFHSETTLSLNCGHHLCEECYANITVYTCNQDSMETRKEQARRKHPLHNPNLEKVILECPKCGSLKNYAKMKAHIRDRHRDILKENVDGRPRTMMILCPMPKEDCSNSPLRRQDNRDKNRNLALNYGPYSERQVRPVRELHKQEEHEWSLMDHKLKYHKYTTAMNSSHLMPGVGSVQQTQITTKRVRPAEFRTATEDDDTQWSHKTREALRNLQESAQKLEQKLNDIEKPLQIIIHRLSQGS